MRLSSCLRTAFGALVTGAWLLSISTAPARAQFAHELRERVVSTESPANLFFDWTGSIPLAGLDVSLPADWSLDAIEVIQNGFLRQAGRLERVDGEEARYVFHLQGETRGEANIVLRVRTSPIQTAGEVTAVPLVRTGTLDGKSAPEPAYRAVRRIRVEPSPPPNANRALVLDTLRQESVQLRATQIPDLSSESTYSLEFWLNTIALDRVVISTWDGEEHSTYPIELMVGRHGRLLYYRGRPGEHLAMSTDRPVADGSWHHVAVVHDAQAGWTRLFLDGAAQDSLYAPHPPHIGAPKILSVGGRIEAPRDSGAELFEGQIDELRVWPEARSARAIRQGMRRSLMGEDSEGLFLSFETPIPREVLVRPVPARRERSSLSFAHPVQDLRASVASGQVSLTWETSDVETESFVIERSTDGRDFLEVGRLDADEPTLETSTESVRRYEFSEAQIDEQVVYYRIRQHLLDGSERITASVKIGLGRPEPDEEAVLVGNYPNPFNVQTTITYRLQESMRVRLSVWDVAGQPVADLVDAVQDPGFYEILFDAGELSSGTYFVRLQTPADVGWGTMTLMK